MNTVTAHIDVSMPAGRRLLRNLAKHKKAVKIEVPLPQTAKTYTLDETFKPLWKKLNEHYGTDLQKL
jgi:hypothetical protein